MRGRKILVSCEHAGNYIPKDYHALFAGAQDTLLSHRGWDPGAYGLARYLARHWAAPMFYQKVSRLLIEMNRSAGSKELFSEFTQHVDRKIKQHLIQKYYLPYRNEVEQKINKYINEGDAVLHISVHTFTPQLNGVVRAVDLGLLFDNDRKEEREFCEKWKLQLDSALPEMLTMLNCPYNGADDGFTTYLRTKYSGQQYLGIEIEVNQKFVETDLMTRIKERLAAGC